MDDQETMWGMQWSQWFSRYDKDVEMVQGLEIIQIERRIEQWIVIADKGGRVVLWQGLVYVVDWCL